MVILSLALFLVAVGIVYSVLIVGKRADEKMKILMDNKIQEPERYFREKRSPRKGNMKHQSIRQFCLDYR